MESITLIYPSGELNERRVEHREEAEQFYRALAAAGMKVRVGMEASGHACWFERLQAVALKFATQDGGTSQTPFIRHAAAVSVTAVERTPSLAPVVRHLPLRQTVDPRGRVLISEFQRWIVPE